MGPRVDGQDFDHNKNQGVEYMAQLWTMLI
ncbi:hypothetical protein BDE27_3348 [Xenorhabdus ehlersii]|uniref:Uncharacterized protein n=1 Tax=Xenorhabdus ehlersii TaxID=290111 RepID=A0A2D0IL15_9GAMM|nr:hypothetical protein Xehl_03617 [Xenorhabdus ehlersii]RKE88697.1 hypothetical protein BDE27_3348 [Xenorhabdus ehlersii]